MLMSRSALILLELEKQLQLVTETGSLSSPLLPACHHRL